PQPIRAGKFSGRALVTLSVLIAAAAYGGWYFYTAPEGITVPTTTADAHDPMPPVMPIDAAAAKKLNTETDAAHADTSDPAKSGSTTSSTPQPPAKTTVLIKALATCWVYIHDPKGKVVFHKTMQKGEEFQIPDGRADLILEMGNPAALQISVNGRVLKTKTGGAQVRKVNVADLAKQQ
ncbi:MAG: DUF4115 domain-containing protein, partial [Dongiaceae bacterium]